ncbi:hypothetical protein D3C73_557760 [compost metagenome]
MRKFMLWITVFMLSMGIGLDSWVPKVEADAMYGGWYEPQGLRIPAEIQLLADTPYYSSEAQSDDEPEGVFAPQTVQVIRTTSSWSTGSTTWEIQTISGPRWIRPKAWEIDIAPPKTITLVEETQLYASKSERGGSVASLSPQEVVVVGAEKQWFYTNQPDSKVWIQIHTTWLGDLWAHIPVSRIGVVQTKQYKAHYNWLYDGNDLASVVTGAIWKENAQAQKEGLKGDFNIVGEYTTIYDRYFQVQTDTGITWTIEKGISILDTNETLEITKETPLLKDMWSYNPQQEIALLQGEKVTAFEKVTERLFTGRGPYPIWNDSTWYHVRTSKGTGWINQLYGEPRSAVSVQWEVDLVDDQREMYRYPEIPFSSSTLLLRNQTLQVSEVWDAPTGATWMKVTVDGRTGWIPFWYGGLQKIRDLDPGTTFQVSLKNTYSAGVYSYENGKYKLYPDTYIGYQEEEQHYLDPVKIADSLSFKVDKSADEEVIRWSQGDYTFQLQTDQDVALIYWKGDLQKSYTLQEKPRITEDGWYLNLTDLRELFGLTVNFSNNEIEYLYEKKYDVDIGTLPTTVKNGRLELKGFMYGPWDVVEMNGGRNPVQISIKEYGDDGGEESVSTEELFVAGTDGSKYAQKMLSYIHASRPLSQGSHDIDVVLRVGERMIWKGSLKVMVEAAK